MNNSVKVGVLGVGAWGMALSLHFARLGYDVYLWCFEDDIFKEMTTTKMSSPYLMGFALPANIIVTQDFQSIAVNCQVIFEFVPLMYLRNVLQSIKPFLQEDFHVLVGTSLGVETETSKFSTEIIQDELSAKIPQVFFSGIGKAHSLAQQDFSAGILAASDIVLGERILQLMSTQELFIDLVQDVKGVQACVSFQHLFSVLPRFLQKRGVAENLKMLLLLNCLREIQFLIQKIGGSVDSVLCFGSGIYGLINQGKNCEEEAFACFLDEAPSENSSFPMFKFTEANSALISILQLGSNLGVELPVCQMLKEFILNNRPIEKVEQRRENHLFF